MRSAEPTMKPGYTVPVQRKNFGFMVAPVSKGTSIWPELVQDSLGPSMSPKNKVPKLPNFKMAMCES
jgi:hypothetical protein